MKEELMELNKDAKRFLYEQIELIEKDEERLNRCKQELDYLYMCDSTLIIKYLYLYKKKYKKTKYLFYGNPNNLLSLYILGLTNVNPIEYNLSMDTCIRYYSLDFFVVNKSTKGLIKFINDYQLFFSLCKADLSKVEGHTEEDYFSYVIRLKEDVNKKKCDSDGVPIIEMNNNNYFKEILISIRRTYINNEFSKKEEKLINQFKPKSDLDYIKIMLLDYNDLYLFSKQYLLYEEKIISLNEIITCREDVYDYLIKHNIDKQTAFDIMTFVRKGKALPKFWKDNTSKFYHLDMWSKYREIMKFNGCEEWFIETLTNIRWLDYRGYIASKYLYMKEKRSDKHE